MSGKDFLFTLKLKQDKNSFEQGAKSVDNVANNISRLIGTARNAAAAMVALGIAGGKVGAADVSLSTQLGLSVKHLEVWKNAAGKAGVSASELTQSMAGLDRKMLEWERRGRKDDATAIASAQLGVDLGKLMAFDADDRVETILEAAQKLAKAEGSVRNASSLVSQLLGGAGEKMFLYLQSSQKSIGSLLSDAEKITLFDDEAARKAFGFNSELNETITIMKQLGTLGGAEFGSHLTDFLGEVNKFFKDHGREIAERITGFSNSVAKIGEALKPFAEGSLKIATEMLFNLTDALAKLLQGDFEGAGDKVVQLVKKIKDELAKLWKGDEEAMQAAEENAAAEGKGAFGQWWARMNAWTGSSKAARLLSTPGEALVQAGKFILTGGGAPDEDELAAMQEKILGALKKDNPKIDVRGAGGAAKKIEALPAELQEAIAFYKLSGGDVAPFQPYISDKLQDGIMRPDGRVTQVAPDDWVFAARNIGDLARMFLPPSVSNNYGAPSLTINQTLNMQGGTPFPQAVKAAAYNGTQDALRSISASALRMQMMPGLR